MDLKNEFLAVLDNPSSVWEAILNNLANEPRVALMTLATCHTPVNIVDWQAAVARISLDSAVQFEASMRVLDDSFVTLRRSRTKRHYANFRNPSMDDFCAAHLNGNVGFAVRVASHNPSLSQIQRLIELGSASTIFRGKTRRRTHGNIHSALIANPTLLYEALLHHIPQPRVINADFNAVITQMISLIVAHDSRSNFNVSEIRSTLLPGLMQLNFTWDSSTLFKLLDSPMNAETLVWILGDHLEEFHINLVEGATSLAHFDTLFNFDSTLGHSGSDIIWRDRFISCTENWLDGGEVELSDADSSRYYYLQIAEHLDLGEKSREQDWDDLVAQAEEEAASDDDDGSWHESPNGADGSSRGILSPMTEEFSTKQAVNTMFRGLIQRGPS